MRPSRNGQQLRRLFACWYYGYIIILWLNPSIILGRLRCSQLGFRAGHPLFILRSQVVFDKRLLFQARAQNAPTWLLAVLAISHCP